MFSYVASWAYGSTTASTSKAGIADDGKKSTPARTRSVRRSSHHSSAKGNGNDIHAQEQRPATPTRCKLCRRTKPPPCTCSTPSGYSFDAERPNWTHVDPAYAAIKYITQTPSLYDVLGIDPNFTSLEELRRAYMARCRVCHPDKFPSYSEAATAAFQRVSLAYETLSKTSSRRAYDLTGAKRGFMGASTDPLGNDFGGDETLRSVLYAMYCEFLENGQLEMVRVLVEALNASNPGLNLGENAISDIETALRRMRGFLLASSKHYRIIKFELIKLYGIQHDLRQLSYFDVFGRLRLSLQLVRVTLSIPMAIDKAMLADDGYNSDDTSSPSDGSPAESVEGKFTNQHGQVMRKTLLGSHLTSILNLAVAVLEKGESIV